MADYENLLDSIDAVIRSNNRREITGQILQNTLHQMVGSLGENYQLAGFATPTLDPNSPDQNVFYITDEAGVYTNFDNITLGAGLSFLMWKNEEWTSKTLDIVTAGWLDEHYVSKAFLRKVFQFFDEDGVEIFPNDTESVVDNIKAMCGLWTNEYLSALGLGEGSTIPTTLAALNDVTITNPQDGQALVYDLASNHWVNATIQSGVDMSVVWAALAAATNEQINISHLTTALNDYVTATSLATTLQSYVTTSALATELASYASQSWVETNYVSKAFFNSLFEAQDVNGNAITPNNSGQTTIDRLKILVGAYTEQYLSALGLSSGGGGGGSSTLAGLNDVTITNPQDGQALIYDAQSSHWVNGAAISMSAVWTALAAATSEQINSSHLTSALSGYVTTSALASELANYVTTSSLATTLADYVTTSALATTLADYGSKTWIDNNYVSKAFFNRLFQAFAPLAEGQTEPTQVEPNDTTTTIDNIKAMFGLWTEQYLSALGLSAGGGHTIGVLNDLNDVTITNPQTDQVLKYNGTQWVNAAAPSGATALSGLTDVAISTLADKDLLQWDYATGKWKNVVLSTVMSGYATTSQLANYLPLAGGTINGELTISNGHNLELKASSSSTDSGDIIFSDGNGSEIGRFWYSNNNFYVRYGSSDSGKIILNSSNISSYAVTSLTGYATESWVGQNYLPLSGGTISGQFIVHPTVYGNYEEGIRIHEADDGWGIITFGATGTSGMNPNTGQTAWMIGKSAYNDFRINPHDSSGERGLRLEAGGDLYWRNNTVYHSGNLPAYPTKASWNYDDVYLKLTGGTINAPSYPCLSLNASASQNYIYIQTLGTNKSSFGYAAGKTFIGNETSYCYLAVNDSGTPLYVSSSLSNSGYELIHSNNIGSQSVSYATSAGSASSATYATSASSATYATSAGSATYATYDSGGYTIANTTWVGNNYLPLAGGTISGTLIMSAGSQSGWREGIRILNASNGWTTLLLGGSATSGSSSETWSLHTYQSTFYFAHNGSNSYDTGLTWSPNGTVTFTANIVATGGVTALSDERHKTIVEDTRLQVSDIARMRAVRYLWNDGRKDNDIHVGSIAQDWQQILPEVVLRANNDEGTLSLQYGVAALISSITIARKVVNNEKRITELERECERLRFENEQLKLKIA